MASQIGGMKNVKIFVLYLMENVGRPLDFVTLNDIVMQTNYIMYLDFAEAFHKMLDDALVEKVGEENGEALYFITEKGRCVAESLHEDILTSILDKSLEAAFRYLDFKKRGITMHAEIRPREDGKYDLLCSLSENGVDIFSTVLALDSRARAERLQENFYARPEIVYRGVHALLAGNINFLFDD